MTQLCCNRVLEDYAVVFFGSVCFKMLRLFIIAAFSVHFFACAFYRVKAFSNDTDDDVAFYVSKNTDPDVSNILIFREPTHAIPL